MRLSRAPQPETGWTTRDDIPLTVRRSPRRRTASIIVQDGNVRLLVPAWTTDREIRAILDKRAAWIASKVATHSARQPSPRARRDGDAVRWLDTVYTLKVREDRIPGVDLKAGTLSVRVRATPDPYLREGAVRRALYSWYRREALSYFTIRTAEMARQLGVIPTHVAVKDYRSRWGSCTASGRIGYSWRLVLAPSRIADYVVAHEVSHLRHLNHSPAFWETVSRLSPDHLEHRRWLREFGSTLAL